jgi:hypothetical protein
MLAGIRDYIPALLLIPLHLLARCTSDGNSRSPGKRGEVRGTLIKKDTSKNICRLNLLP